MSAFFGLITLLLAIGACVVGLSAWSFSYLAGLLLLAAAGSARDGRWTPRVVAAGIAILGVTFALRPGPSSIDYEADFFEIITLPTHKGITRSINSTIPESDGALFAASLMGMPPDGGEKLTDVLRAAYARMERDIGKPATPAIATYLGMQSPDAFDTIVIDSERRRPPTSAVIFLHGYGGNFDIYC